jgi:hypothetical protein
MKEKQISDEETPVITEKDIEAIGFSYFIDGIILSDNMSF